MNLALAAQKIHNIVSPICIVSCTGTTGFDVQPKPFWHDQEAQRQVSMAQHGITSRRTTSRKYRYFWSLSRRKPISQKLFEEYTFRRQTGRKDRWDTVLRDRIVQEALRAILDPIYEADFQPYSFGFRKGRCTMDAIAVVMSLTGPTQKYYYVIEGDIKGYFDTVHHRKLLCILKQRIADKDILDLIWKFLKAGVMEEGLFARTETGVPQGGVISPLLANVYLNEFDKWAETKWNLLKTKKPKTVCRKRQLPAHPLRG